MAGFLYFVPGLKGLSPTDRLAVGLDEVLAGTPLAVGQLTGGGPDGQAGVVAAVDADADHADGEQPEVAYRASAQTWERAPNGKFWIGIETAKPPRPVDLQRPTILPGYWCAMQDGSRWIVPVARHFDAGTALPSSLYLGDNGQVVTGAVLARFAALSAAAERAWGVFRAEMGLLDKDEKPPRELSERDSWDIAIEAIRTNYRVGHAEASFLGKRGAFLTTEAIAWVLRALFDWQGWAEAETARQEAERKKASAATPSG